MLLDTDADGDGRLDYGELKGNDSLAQTLGLQSTTDIMMQFDTDGDGTIDSKEMQGIIKQLVPTLRKEQKKLERVGDFVGANTLRHSIFDLNEKLQEGEVELQQEQCFERRSVLKQFMDQEMQLLADRWVERFQALEAEFEAKRATLERQHKRRMYQFHTYLKHQRQPGAPIVAKIPPHVVDMRRRLDLLAKAKAYEEASRLQTKLRKLEAQARAKFEAEKPVIQKKREKVLLQQHEQDKRKLEQQRLDARSHLLNQKRQDEARLLSRLKIHKHRMEHGNRKAMQDKIMRGVVSYTLPQLPSLQRPKTTGERLYARSPRGVDPGFRKTVNSTLLTRPKTIWRAPA